MSSLFFLLLFTFLIPSWACQSDLDCSLNGVCNINTHICQCDPWWKGDDCGALALTPAIPNSGYNRTSENISSWGGKVIWDEDTSTYRMYAAEFINHCGLDQWSPNSRVILASSPTITGPYTLTSEILSVFHHNPTVIYHPQSQLYLLYTIGCNIPMNVTVICKNGIRYRYHDISCASGNTENGESGITLWTSPTLTGPWTEVGMILGGNTNGTWDADTTNPSPYVQPDGSIILAYRGCTDQCGGTEQLSIAYASTYNDTYIRMKVPINHAQAEDPFIWKDHRGYWHILYHSLEAGGGFGDGPKVGRHAYAYAWNNTWTVNMNTLAYDTTVHFTDGSITTYYRRERPQLIFSSKHPHIPTHLINGVQPIHSSQSYTLIQPLITSWMEENNSRE